MNLPTKLTVSRIILAILIIVILIFPFSSAGINLPKLFVNESLVVDIRYLIAGILFFIASITDMVDGHLARRFNMVTKRGEILDCIADKILIFSTLVILSSYGFIHPIIPLVIIIRDVIVDKIRTYDEEKIKNVKKMVKAKSYLMMIGITLVLFYNLPFELWNLRMADVILLVGTILSIISGVQYYNLYDKSQNE